MMTDLEPQSIAAGQVGQAAAGRSAPGLIPMLVCQHCDWRFVLPATEQLVVCPHCQQAGLASTKSPFKSPPELTVPFEVPLADVSQRLARFSSRLWFAPGDLSAQNLYARLRRVYQPMWLVDAGATATWRADAGFEYQVVSHEETFDETGADWSVQRVHETRVRWEPRAGRLLRHYKNIPAPALEEDARLQETLGTFDLAQARPFQPPDLEGALVRLPNRSTEDAWPDAEPALQRRAAQECQQACGADQWREFRWTPSYSDLHWTRLLLPVFLTHYADDDGRVVPVLVHGQTGLVSGRRVASMSRARRASLILAAVALGIFIASFLTLWAAGSALMLETLGTGQVLRSLSAVGLWGALVVGLLAPWPVVYVWRVNSEFRVQNAES